MSPLGNWNFVVLGKLAYFPVELHLPHGKLPTYPLEIIDIADRERLISVFSSRILAEPIHLKEEPLEPEHVMLKATGLKTYNTLQRRSSFWYLNSTPIAVEIGRFPRTHADPGEYHRLPLETTLTEAVIMLIDRMIESTKKDLEDAKRSK